MLLYDPPLYRLQRLLHCLHHEINNIKHAKDTDMPGAQKASLISSQNSSPINHAKVLREHIVQYLHEEILKTPIGHKISDNECGLYYPLFCLLDEIILSALPQELIAQWESHLLEEHFFHTRQAGALFFVRLENILNISLAHHGYRATQKEARMYLYALNMGFYGRYRGLANANDILMEYRKRVFHWLHPQKALDQNILESSAAFTYTSQRYKPWPKLLSIGVVVCVYGFCAAAMHYITSDIFRQHISSILS